MKHMTTPCTECGSADADISRAPTCAANKLVTWSPVQRAGGHAIKGALALCWERRARAPVGARVVMCVHDKLLAECDIAAAEATAAWLSGCMRDSLQPLLRHVPAVAKATIGADWAGASL
jgi:DNA polymerase I-like protein with 3'-5' exonuclease and polymerase domains